MSYSYLMRLSGAAAILAGVLSIIFILGVFANVISTSVEPPRGLVTIILTIFALMGIYARQYTKAGILGLLGFILAEIGLFGNLGVRYLFTFVVPVLNEMFPDAAGGVGQYAPYNLSIQATFLIFVFGYVLFGLGTWRAGVFSRWAAVMFSLGAVLSYILLMLPLNVGVLLSAVGLIWMGYEQWKVDREVVQPEQSQTAV